MDPVAPPIGDLSPGEVRVLGCLVEKEATVPDTYPLTLNSLRTACNQTTSRDPVVQYSDHDVEVALAALRQRGLTRTVHSTSNRATKYRHALPDALELGPAETAVLAVLMLRGPQTVGELKSRTERQHSFGSAEQVADVLAGLAARATPLVRRLERQPGQKDVRWVHLLAPVPEGPASTAAGSPDTARGPVDTSTMSDPYGAATAEFYDLLATGMWESFGFQLLDLLGDVDPAAGPIVDVGVGTGVGLPYLTAAVPGASIWAIEPSRAMRTALHTRMLLDDALRAAVTVVPFGMGDAPLPERASAVVVSAAYGHLTDGERRRLWRYVAEQLAPGAPAVVGVLPPDRSIEVEPVRYRRLDVGSYTYEGWQRGEPIDDRTMRWTMTYKVLHGDALVTEYSTLSRWRCDGPADVRDEIAHFGLSLEEHDGCVVVRRPGQRGTYDRA